MPVDVIGREIKVGQKVAYIPKWASTKTLRVGTVVKIHPKLVEMDDAAGLRGNTKRYPDEVAIIEEVPECQ